MLGNMAFLQVVKYLLYGIGKEHFYAAKCSQTCIDASQKRKEEKLRGGWSSFSDKKLHLWRKKQARVHSVRKTQKKIFGLEQQGAQLLIIY